jgi:3-deoxy-D-manno-octulosonate 8-phosphate phosphatase KdsC-like HAD superfamily phosphatase
LDVDGVMTDGGMYVSENGDQMKRYNTQDGMGIMHLTKSNFQVGIISSGFTNNIQIKISKREFNWAIRSAYQTRT